MAVITSQANGDWATGGTWAGGTAPGDGDSAVIAHDVTLTTDVTVGPDSGADPAPTADAAIYLDAGGTLTIPHTISADVTLTLKGPLLIDTDCAFIIGTDSSNPIPAARTVTIQHAGSFEFEHWIRGTLKMFGSPAYHMADAASQRTRLAADAAAASPATLTFQDPVDYVAGDVIWLGTGGTPDNAPTACEQVTVIANISSTQVTANTTQNHFGDSTYGDLVIHGERNVKIIGVGTTQGFSILAYSDDSNYDATTIFDINWAYFQYAGSGSGITKCVFNFRCVQTSGNGRYQSGAIKIKNNVYDTPGDAAARVFNYNTAEFHPDQTHEDVSENHAWEYANIANAGASMSRLLLGHLSLLEATAEMLESGGSNYDIDGLWYVADGTANPTRQVGPVQMSTIRNFKVHNAYKGIYIANASASTISSPLTVIENGEIFHIYGTSGGHGLDITAAGVYEGPYVIKNVKFHTIRDLGADIEVNGFCDIIDCTFDNCNIDNATNQGGVNLSGTVRGGRYRLTNCDFGLDVVNKRSNIYLAAAMAYSGHHRYIAVNCTCKEPSPSLIPTAVEWGPHVPNHYINWIFQLDPAMADWRNRVRQSAFNTIEYVNCEMLDGSDVPQWANEYPKTNVLAFTDGGGEVHKVNQTDEPAGYIDGTFARKMMPFKATIRSNMTRNVPIIIPVTAGQSLDVKLSFKKNISQIAGRRPMLHALGAGIDEYEEMPDTTATWEELNITGTALYDDVVHIWVSCWAVQDFHLGSAPPTRAQVDDYNWAYPIDPGGTGTGVGTPDNLILYCDGLSIDIT